jgi:hypothetical protein
MSTGNASVTGEKDEYVKAHADGVGRRALFDLRMKKHLATTTDEVVARLNKNWDGDVRAYDAVYDHILHVADALSDGIVKQFPEKFRMTP